MRRVLCGGGLSPTRLLILGVFLLLLTACAHQALVQPDGTPETPKEQAEDKAIQKLPGTPNGDLDNSGSDINQIPVEVNGEVEKWIEYFQGRGRDYFERYLERSTRYMPIMKKVLKENGVPEDLVYIAMIESGFSGKIKSRAKAVGFWQFIGGTGKHYGLRVNRLVDERYDPVRSTEAAASYFKGLYNLFGSWYLAIASYNVGENRIKAMVMKNYTRNFWDLAVKKQLPAETIQYIPKFLAARLISREPEKYGFTGLNYEEPMEFDTVTSDQPLDMRVLAKSMKIDYDELRDLNMSYKTQYVPVLGGVATIRVPAGTAAAAKLVMVDAVVKNNKSLIRMSDSPTHVTFTRYRVKRGETLSAIANRFDISVKDILKHNRIRHNKIRPGQTLRIPSSETMVKVKKSTFAKIRRHREELPPLIYIVRRGDTLSRIAHFHDVSLKILAKRNRLAKNSKVLRGQKLVIPRVAEN